MADYVLAEYGTGVVMGVPAHDDRDFQFAKDLGIPIAQVVRSVDGDDRGDSAFTADGVLTNSGEFTGLTYEQAR